MRVLIDADGCPVLGCAIRVAKRFGVPVLLLCDTAHEFTREGAQTITVSKGADSADFALVNLLHPGDAVITQDYGLAAMCLARGALPIHQDGNATRRRILTRFYSHVTPPRGSGAREAG